MPECKHPNTPEECWEVLADVPEGQCVCYMKKRTGEQEKRFQKIIKAKVGPPEGEQQDCDFRRYVFLIGTGSVFRSVVFTGGANFSNAAFGGDAEFYKATFRAETFFRDVVFHQKALFKGTTYCHNVSFLRSIFGGDAHFNSSTFNGSASFRLASFRGAAQFQFAIGVNNRAVVLDRTRLPLGRASSLYRLAKQACLGMGGYAAAGDYHYQERVHGWCAHSRLPHDYLQRWDRWFRARDRARKKRCRMARWSRIVCRPSILLHAMHSIIRHGLRAKNREEFLLANLAFGYGERLWRPVVTGLLVIAFSAWIFLFTGIRVGGDSLVRRLPWPSVSPAEWLRTVTDFGHCLYFSVVTFSTLGYGDIAPASIVSRVLANAESLIGLALVAAFAVCLAKRFARG